MRKQINTLAATVQEKLGSAPFSRAPFVNAIGDWDGIVHVRCLRISGGGSAVPIGSLPRPGSLEKC